MPGYTHLQRAIPVTLGHHLLAWVEMLERDRARLRFAGRAGDALAARRRRARRLDAAAPAAARPDAQLDRRRLRPRLRARLPLRLRRALHAPLADRRGARALDDERVRLRAAARGGGDRLVDDAAEAERRRRRARARQGGHRDRPAHRPARDGQGPAARLQPRPAGGQAAGLRSARRRSSARSAALDRARARASRFDRERLAAACADPLLRATDAAEALVRDGVPFRDAHEQVAAQVRAGTLRAARRTSRRGSAT